MRQSNGELLIGEFAIRKKPAAIPFPGGFVSELGGDIGGLT